MATARSRAPVTIPGYGIERIWLPEDPRVGYGCPGQREGKLSQHRAGKSAVLWAARAKGHDGGREAESKGSAWDLA